MALMVKLQRPVCRQLPQIRSTSNLRAFDIGDCGPPQPECESVAPKVMQARVEDVAVHLPSGVRHGKEDLYDVINERYERGSILLTSNRDRAEWPDLFGEPLLASAALDRLTHGAHFVEITGQSFRAEHTKKQLTARRARRANAA